MGLQEPATGVEGNASPGGGPPGNHEAGLSGSAATIVISGRLEDGASVSKVLGWDTELASCISV